MMFKRAKTYEEEIVESTFFISILLALPLVGVSVFVTPLGQIFGGQPQAIPSFADLMLRLFGFHVIVTVLLAARHKFNGRQYAMLAKVMLGLDLILPLSLILWAYLALYVLLASGVFILTVPVLLAFFGLWALLRKLFGARVNGWVRIKYVPEKGSVNIAQKHLSNAKSRIEKGNFEGASQEFHGAATMFLRLEQWPEAAENYWTAAETLAKEPNTRSGFGIAWLYALSSAAYLLSGEVGRAGRAVELGRKAVETNKIDKKAKERALLLLDALAIMMGKDAAQANEVWQNLSKKLKRWNYTTVEETQTLLEKDVEAIRTQTIQS